jgi:hypothetical protein
MKDPRIVELKKLVRDLVVYSGRFDELKCEHNIDMPDCPNKDCEDRDMYLRVAPVMGWTS